MAGQHTADTLFVNRVVNAAALRGLMSDARWMYAVGVIQRLWESARAQEAQARREPTFDGMLKAAHFNSRALAYEDLLRTFDSLLKGSEAILAEASSKLPYAPQPKEDHRKPAAPESGHPQGDSNDRTQ